MFTARVSNNSAAKQNGSRLGRVVIHYSQYCLFALAQMVARLPLVQRVRDSIPGGVVNFYFKIFNFGARRDGDVHFLIARLYITVLD